MLLAVCLVAVAVRGWLAWTAVAIFVDGALFIDYAQRLAVEPVEVMRAYDQHPAYPAMILAVRSAAGAALPAGNDGWIAAGRIAAIGGSLAAVLAMYWLAARLYSRRVGLIAAAMLAVLPDACQYGAAVLSDLPHIGLYLLGLAALVTGVQARRAAWLIAAAALSAAAFLTRPEGGAVFLIGAAAVLVQRGRRPMRRVAIAAAMAAVFFAIAGPYQAALGKLLPKKSIEEMFGFGDMAAAAERKAPLCTSAGPRGFADGDCGEGAKRTFAISGLGGGARRSVAFPSADRSAKPSFALAAAALAADLPVTIDLLRQWGRAGKVVYILLAIAGLALAPPRGAGGRLLAAALGVHIALLHALSLSFHYLDLRHALLLAVLSLPVAAAGAWELAGRMRRRPAAEANDRTASRMVRATNVAIVLVVCLVSTWPWLMRPINAGEEHVVATARWIEANTPPDALVVGDRRMHRVAVHANRAFEEWHGFRPAPRDAYFVVDEAHIGDAARNPSGFENPQSPRPPARGTVELVHSEASPEHARGRTRFFVYRFKAGG